MFHRTPGIRYQVPGTKEHQQPFSSQAPPPTPPDGHQQQLKLFAGSGGDLWLLLILVVVLVVGTSICSVLTGKPRTWYQAPSTRDDHPHHRCQLTTSSRSFLLVVVAASGCGGGGEGHAYMSLLFKTCCRGRFQILLGTYLVPVERFLR